MNRMEGVLMARVVQESLRLSEHDTDDLLLQSPSGNYIGLPDRNLDPEDLDKMFRSMHSWGCHPSFLNLQCNKLTYLPSSIGLLGSLTALDLALNYLEALPDSLCSLTNLRYLSVSYNKLKELPRGIGSLSMLSELRLTDNELTYLPHSLHDLVNLRRLRVSRNRLDPFCRLVRSLTSRGVWVY